MIRPTETADRAAILKLAEQTGVFKPAEIVALGEVLDDYYATNQALGHQAITLEEEGAILGFAYYAPAAMTDRTWHLWWIAVRKVQQARGLGGRLLKHAEDDIARLSGRQILIETSSLPRYDPTRKFYLKHHYEQVAVLPDFYADGDHMVVFRKQIDVPRHG